MASTSADAESEEAERKALEQFQNAFEERFYAARQMVDSWIPASVKADVGGSSQGRAVQGRPPRLGIGAKRSESETAKSEADKTLRRHLLSQKAKQEAQQPQSSFKAKRPVSDSDNDDDESRASTIKGKKENKKRQPDAFTKSKPFRQQTASCVVVNSPSLESAASSSARTTPSVSVLSTSTSNASPDPQPPRTQSVAEVVASTSQIPLPWSAEPTPAAASPKGKGKATEPPLPEEEGEASESETWSKLVAEVEERDEQDKREGRPTSPAKGPYRIPFDGDVATNGDDDLLNLASKRKHRDSMFGASNPNGEEETSVLSTNADPGNGAAIPSAASKRRKRKKKKHKDSDTQTTA